MNNETTAHINPWRMTISVTLLKLQLALWRWRKQPNPMLTQEHHLPSESNQTNITFSSHCAVHHAYLQQSYTMRKNLQVERRHTRPWIHTKSQRLRDQAIRAIRGWEDGSTTDLKHRPDFDLQNPPEKRKKRKENMTEHVCNPSVGEADTGGSLGFTSHST